MKRGWSAETALLGDTGSSEEGDRSARALPSRGHRGHGKALSHMQEVLVPGERIQTGGVGGCGGAGPGEDGGDKGGGRVIV